MNGSTTGDSAPGVRTEVALGFTPFVLLRQEESTGLRAEQPVVFRRWVRANVRVGRTLKTAVGVIRIDSVAVLMNE